MRFDKDVISIDPTYPALDRAAFLIERTCVPRYYPPRYCAEAAQQRRNPQENRPHSMQRTL